MTPEEYIKKALRTERKDYDFVETNNVSPRVENGILGVAGEAGELIDAMKTAKIYRKGFDRINIIEEMGDMMWYLALMADALDVTFEEIWDKNIRKLKARYPEKFTKDKAINRNIKKERKEMEKTDQNVI